MSAPGVQAPTKEAANAPQPESGVGPAGANAPPKGPWGDRGVTSPLAGTTKPQQKESSLNVRINLDLRADVSLELHAVVQGDITIGLF
ncbi:hypothetical protein FE257_012052 [Aspergillus nanangensis]|uniref:Uncharacterized protein n=1 Tax=Aspergillus nanangensis TaxID=2582783 RepID=A0AAD4CGX4_ASPNN|nr:hypothetical protein FE257_012052 [Aspergillus nanangensis]